MSFEQDEQLIMKGINYSPEGVEKTSKIGDLLSTIMDSRIEPQHDRYCLLYEIWKQLLPEALSEHCQIESISNGQLKVLVDSPSYMYHMQLCCSNILAELERQCPQLRIKKLKFALV